MCFSLIVYGALHQREDVGRLQPSIEQLSRNKHG